MLSRTKSEFNGILKKKLLKIVKENLMRVGVHKFVLNMKTVCRVATKLGI